MKGGIVGCGYFGQIQLASWRRMPHVEIVAAADPNLERARASAPRAYASAEEMFDHEQLDFVDIATRPGLHLALVRLAAERHIPTICQKPMALDFREAVEMTRIAEEHLTRLMIHENWRWQPWHREAKRLIDAGTIGTPIGYFFQVRRADGRGETPFTLQPYFKEMPKLMVYEMLVHQIDTARFLFGEVRSVYAQMQTLNPVLIGEDRVSMILAHGGNLQGVIDGHRYLDPLPQGPAMGIASFDGDKGTLDIQATGDIFFNGELIWKAPDLPGYKGDSVRMTQEHFIECLRTGAEFESSARDYLRTFGPVEAAYVSARSGRVVAIREDGSFDS